MVNLFGPAGPGDVAPKTCEPLGGKQIVALPGVDGSQNERLDLMQHDEGAEPGVRVVGVQGVHEIPLALGAASSGSVSRSSLRVLVVVDEETDPVDMARPEQAAEPDVVLPPTPASAMSATLISISARLAESVGTRWSRTSVA